MRFAVYLVLVVVAAIAAFSGNLLLALALGGAKALLVGVEYMELRTAARAHALVFALTIVAFVAGLGLIAA